MQREKGDADGNSRLTALLGATVLPLFFAAWLSGKLGGPSLITAHITISLLFLAPMAAKLVTVTYRMVSYYRGVGAYRRRGRPAGRLRLLGAALGVAVVVMLASGLVMLVGPVSAYRAAKSIHSLSAWIAIVALALHLVWHLRETRHLVVADLRSGSPQADSRRLRLAAVGAVVLVGAILALALFQQASTIRQRARVAAAVSGHQLAAGDSGVLHPLLQARAALLNARSREQRADEHRRDLGRCAQDCRRRGRLGTQPQPGRAGQP